jgi:hypothetical protein
MTNTPNAPRQPQPAARQQQTGGSLLNQMNARAVWEMLALTDTVIQFDIHALGKPLYDRIGIEMPEDTSDAEAVITALVSDKSLHEPLKARLDEAWESYQMCGAILVYNWREEVKQVMNMRLLAIRESPRFVRALDSLLVLNVLARARSSLLLATAPLALERPFLTRTLASDDPRLQKLVSVSHYIELPFFEPPPEPPAEEPAE